MKEEMMPLRILFRILIALAVLWPQLVLAAELTAVRGVVHDPQHRPIAGATVTLRAANSAFVVTERTNTSGEFSLSAVPLLSLIHI